MTYLFTRKSRNIKTGPIPVTSAPKQNCAPDCPLREKGCYALGSHLGVLWAKLSDSAGNAFKHGRASIKPISWRELCDSVRSLPDKQIWRHNQMGDLPHNAGKIDRRKLNSLVAANRGKRGFTYTHHNALQSDHNRDAIEKANRNGFTINLSGNNPMHADLLADLDVAPVVTILPAAMSDQTQTSTPAGRKVTICPAIARDNVTCKSCGLCAIADRDTIIGFPAHGFQKRAAENI